jgi:hypothetical protein
VAAGSRGGIDACSRDDYHMEVERKYRAGMDGSGGANQAKRNRFTVAGHAVCRAALALLHGVSERTLGRYAAKLRGGDEAGAASSRPRGAADPKAAALRAWYQDQVVDFGNQQPGQPIIVVDAEAWTDLHKRYADDLKARGDADLVGDVSYIRRVVQSTFPHVRRRKTKGVSGKCVTCDAIWRAKR